MLQYSISLDSEFKLDDKQTSVIVPRTGYYFINLKINYKVPDDYDCKGQKPFFLCAEIKQYHPEYPQSRNIVRTIESMQCLNNWQQSLSLNRVEKIKSTTKLYVKINQESFSLIILESLDIFFDVTFLQNSRKLQE